MAGRLSAGPRVERFMARFLRHTKGKWAGQPVTMESWQQDALFEMFLIDAKTRLRVYTDILFGLPRKNAKSTLCAGIALYLAGPDNEPGAEVYATAGSSDQADIVFGQAKGFIDANPELLRYFTPRERTIRVPATNGILRRLAADGKLNHGLNVHGAIIDELHSFVTNRQVDNYEAITTASAAREQPWLGSITTAGDDPDTILGGLYELLMESPNTEHVGKDRERLKAGLSIYRDPDTGQLIMWYGADRDADIENPEVWRACNPASWVTIEYLRRRFKSPSVPETSFRKLHLNMFVNARQVWLPFGTWAGLVSATDLRSRIAIGVDVGLTSDTTAVSWAAPAEDGSDRLAVRCHVWSAREDVPHHTFVPGGRVDLELVEDFIRQLAGRYNVSRLHYDPRFFERSAQSLSKEGMTVAPLNQNSAPMADAYHEFYVDARTGKFAHDGDPVLQAHVESAAGVKTERGWRVSKLKSNRRIDACVASAMALYGARRMHEDVEPWVGAV